VLEVLGPLAEKQSYLPLAADAFQEKLLAILQDQNLANSLGQENRARIESHYSQQAMISAYEQLYGSLVHVS
jgi:glycosyltransferase involved in cell wall biosynthesis